MATQNSPQYGSGVPQPGAGMAGNAKILFGSHTLATNLAINSTVNMFTMPKGFTPILGWLHGADLDTGTEALELDVGITGDVDKYLNSGVITGDPFAAGNISNLAAGGIIYALNQDLCGVVPTVLTVDTDVILTFTAAAAAGGTGVISVTIIGVYNDARVNA